MVTRTLVAISVALFFFTCHGRCNYPIDGETARDSPSPFVRKSLTQERPVFYLDDETGMLTCSLPITVTFMPIKSCQEVKAGQLLFVAEYQRQMLFYRSIQKEVLQNVWAAAEQGICAFQPILQFLRVQKTQIKENLPREGLSG